MLAFHISSHNQKEPKEFQSQKMSVESLMAEKKNETPPLPPSLGGHCTYEIYTVI